MRKIKFGIFGLGRGSSFYNSILVNDGDIVAVCDRDEAKLAAAKTAIGEDVATYTDFDAFIAHEGLEAVFLCNFFHEHTPYAIKALERNIHVLSECTSNGTMAEGVALIRAAEKSQAIYMLAENYPFMKFNQEMYRVYRGGTLGKALFAEGEYNHPLDPADTKSIKKYRPYSKHWRNYLPRTYYITHSLAPLMYITGATPVRVTAMPVFCPDYPSDTLMGLAVGDRSAIITCLNDDDSVFRVTGCAAYGAHGNSYRLCCVKGQIENLRGTDGKVMLRYNKWNIPEGKEANNFYMPEWPESEREAIEKAGHGGGDYFVIKEFFNCIRECRRPVFDEYFATTAASVGILSHRSLLERGVPYDIPDFHREEDRKKYENDTISPFYGSDGTEPTIPCCSHPGYMASQEEIDYYNSIIEE
ncbi:MAG: Gfo/Idh/MocA family oxidoreductase [Clostridia bacterium]|nr:Gfo/Idh/MocA family oxidoreductase [Clostridia bacterium]